MQQKLKNSKTEVERIELKIINEIELVTKNLGKNETEIVGKSSKRKSNFSKKQIIKEIINENQGDIVNDN